jgi:large subunit ribosomal protein L29
VSLEAKDLRGNDPDELRRTARKLEEDLFKHKLKKTTNQLENTMLIRYTRRDIARVNTVLAERLRGAPVAPVEKSAEKPAIALEGAEASAAKPAKAATKATKPKAAAEATSKPTSKKAAKET